MSAAGPGVSPRSGTAAGSGPGRRAGPCPARPSRPPGRAAGCRPSRPALGAQLLGPAGGRPLQADRHAVRHLDDPWTAQLARAVAAGTDPVEHREQPAGGLVAGDHDAARDPRVTPVAGPRRRQHQPVRRQPPVDREVGGGPPPVPGPGLATTAGTTTATSTAAEAPAGASQRVGPGPMPPACRAGRRVARGRPGGPQSRSGSVQVGVERGAQPRRRRADRDRRLRDLPGVVLVAQARCRSGGRRAWPAREAVRRRGSASAASTAWQSRVISLAGDGSS